MPERNDAVLDFLHNRRSRPWKLLQAPVPDDAEVMSLLTAAARVPDHGKLEPWRFVVLREAALKRLAPMVTDRGAALNTPEDKISKEQQIYQSSPLAIAVIEVHKPSPKIPQIEQTYSAGAVCLGLLNAALAAGWGANWLSGWPSHDRAFAAQALGLEGHERIAGLIHIGTASATPPERPRPDVAALTTWVSS